jgi:dihydroorotate dehydrogenase (NAD+) catalytic subunit
VLSFMGTVKEGQTQDEFIADYALAARLAKETGAPILEANLSCPNIGNEGLVCYNLEVTKKVCEAIRHEIGNTPFIIKIGYFPAQGGSASGGYEDGQLAKLAQIVHEYVDDVAAINTLPGTVVDASGNQALPGPNRAKSGVCGASIRWAGLDMVRRLKTLKDVRSYRFAITGVGGVVSPADYAAYRDAGADTVMSATGTMWNPYLAEEIKRASS